MKFLTIRINDVASLVKKEGGAMGSLAATLAPNATENLVYSKMANEILSGFRGKGISADVNVVENVSGGSPAPSDFWKGVGVGGVGVGVLFGLSLGIKALLSR